MNNILIVDDEETILELIGFCNTHKHYESRCSQCEWTHNKNIEFMDILEEVIPDETDDTDIMVKE